MKRISPWLMLLIFLPGVCEAYGYGCGVRYTPYAFTYRHSGLVSGDVEYTPYAFTYRNSGLVPGYGVSSGSYSDYPYSVATGRFKGVSRPAFRASRPMHRRAQDTTPSVRPQDGMDIIRQHLTAKGFTSVGVARILRIDEQLVSVDILVKDRNLLIKYWNPQEIQAMGTKESFKQKAYEKYRQDWTRVAAQHEQAGREILSVEAADAQTIVAALDSCEKLGPDLKAPDQEVMYASK